MIYKSETPVFCRCCGKPIRKHTKWVYVKRERGEHDRTTEFSGWHYGILRNKAECQAVVDNDHVVSVQYGNGSIIRFTTWDRVSYVDRFFCTNKCAIRLAYHVAATGYAMAGFLKATKNTSRVGGGRRVAL